MRDIKIDNLRGILIFLVVFGHFIELGIERHDTVRDIYIFIYLVHMPLFVCVAGYFSRIPLDLRKIWHGVVRPYILAELAYRIYFYLFISQQPSLIAPTWILWFLVSLACWRVLLPIWIRLTFPFATALIISLSTGLVEHIGLAFSLSRTVYFFPFFVFGYQISQDKIPRLNSKALAFGILALGIILVVMLPQSYSLGWVYGGFSYAQIGVTNALGILFRLAHYGAAAVLGLAIFTLTPKRESILTFFGTKTMWIFIGHGFVALAAQALAFGETSFIIISSTIISLAICLCTLVLKRPKHLN